MGLKSVWTANRTPFPFIFIGQFGFCRLGNEDEPPTDASLIGFVVRGAQCPHS